MTPDDARAFDAWLKGEQAKDLAPHTLAWLAWGGALAYARRQTGLDPEMGFMLEAANAGEIAAYEDGCIGMMAALAAVLDGKDDGRGVANEPWETLRRRVLALMASAPAMSKSMQKRMAHAPKDHEIARAVNELRDIALKYHATQQLRERIARVLQTLFNPLEP